MFDYRRLSNGLLLVLLGVVLMLNTFGILSWTVWFNVLRYWPLLLVAAGVGIVFGRRIPGSAVIAAALLIMVTLSWIAGPQNWDGWFITRGSGNYGNLTRQWADETNPLTSTTVPMSVDLRFNAGRLNVNGSTDQAYVGKLGYFSDRPTVAFSQSNSGADLRLSSIAPPLGGLPAWFTGNKGPWNEWNLSLNGQAPLDLKLNASASDTVLDLSQLNVTDFTADTSAGSLKVDLGDRAATQTVEIDASAGSVDLSVGKAAKVTIKVGMSAGSVSINVPAGAGLRVTESLSASSSNANGLGLTKSGNTWTSPNFDQAAQKIEIDFHGSAASLSISR